MYILVNENNIIVGSAVNKPDENSCSKNNQKIFKIKDEEYSVELLGTKLLDYDVIERI